MQNKQLISAIQAHLPAHIKPVTFVMDTLDLGRESAYRRLRGEIPFSFDEIASLARKLNFSVDEIITDKPLKTYCDFPQWNSDPMEIYCDMLRQYSKFFHEKEIQNAEVTVSQNRISCVAINANASLLQFNYYRFLHQINCIDSNRALSEVKTPEKILNLQKEMLNNSPKVNKFSYIYDKRILQTLCSEMQYFYHRKLISVDEIATLKDALNDTIDIMYKTSVSPLANKTPIYFYVSLFDIGINTTHFQYGDNMISQFWVFPFNVIEIKNAEVCQSHKRFLDMLKKYSVLISQSNELARENFFAQQHRYIDNITSDNPNFY
ncbi:MAG: hypothetical protein LBB41_03750 [Prevotellaceae bacterium]|jgi:hypothetical protein|nr:hypothetical protein [Prevotellaceae bacterium]